MKTLQNNFTTPEQSKRMLELGVPADSADCYYCRMTSKQFDQPTLIGDKATYTSISTPPYNLIFLPCWSIGRLMEIVDICCKWNLYEDWLKYRISDETIGIPIEHIVSTLEYLSSDNSIDFSKLDG